MNVGMLWYDNDPKADLQTKINRAVGYYEKKYGLTPDLCYVNPSMLRNHTIKPGAIDVQANRSILPNHLWIGIHVPVAS
jgi:hypothetical protein